MNLVRLSEQPIKENHGNHRKARKKEKMVTADFADFHRFLLDRINKINGIYKKQENARLYYELKRNANAVKGARVARKTDMKNRLKKSV